LPAGVRLNRTPAAAPLDLSRFARRPPKILPLRHRNFPRQPSTPTVGFDSGTQRVRSGRPGSPASASLVRPHTNAAPTALLAYAHGPGGWFYPIWRIRIIRCRSQELQPRQTRGLERTASLCTGLPAITELLPVSRRRAPAPEIRHVPSLSHTRCFLTPRRRLEPDRRIQFVTGLDPRHSEDRAQRRRPCSTFQLARRSAVRGPYVNLLDGRA
jgi:hypothetical protein